MPLTAIAIRAAKAGPKPQRLFDGGGLYLEVSPDGGEKDPEYFAVARDRLSREITNRKASIEPPKISARAIKKDAAKRDLGPTHGSV